MQCTVKWWNDSKGYGFVSDDKERDIFCHYSAIQGDGFKTLAEGMIVECEVIDGPKGPQVTKVIKIL